MLILDPPHTSNPDLSNGVTTNRDTHQSNGCATMFDASTQELTHGSFPGEHDGEPLLRPLAIESVSKRKSFRRPFFGERPMGRSSAFRNRTFVAALLGALCGFVSVSLAALTAGEQR